MELRFGTATDCSDGTCGRLTGIVLEPASWTVTHLVVEPAEGHPLARLIPMDLVAEAGDRLVLDCTHDRWRTFEYFEEVHFTDQAADQSWGGLLLWPLTTGAEIPVVTEHLPADEVEISEADATRARDGFVGHLDGVIVDSNCHLTHVLVREGHLWRKKEVAILAASVERMAGDGIHVALTKHEIAKLPARFLLITLLVAALVALTYP